MSGSDSYRRAIFLAMVVAVLVAGGAYFALDPATPSVVGSGPGGRDLPVRARALPEAGRETGAEQGRDATEGRAQVRATTGVSTQVAMRAVRGRCVDTASAALPGVRVTWVAENLERVSIADSGSEWVLTDGSGSFRLEGLPLDRPMRVFFGAEGFLPVSWALDAQADPVELDLGTIVLARGVRILGIVTDEQGTPLRGVTVELRRWTESERAQEPRSEQLERAVTNGFGEFELGACLPGTYFAQCPGYVVLQGEQALVSPTVEEHRMQLVVTTGTGDRLLQGRVKNTRGQPLEGAGVYATNGKGGHWRATTNAQGEFRMMRDRAELDGLTISAVASGHALETAPTTYPWGSDDAELTLRRTPGVALEVLDPAGRGVASYSVRIYRIGAHPLAPLQRDPLQFPSDIGPDGFTRIPELIEGAYWVRVEPEGRSDLERSPFMPLVVRVDARTEERAQELRIVLPRRVERRLKLILADRSALPGCGVELFETPPEAREGGAFEGAPLGRAFKIPRHELAVMGGRSNGQGELRLHSPSNTPLTLEIMGPGCMPKSVELPRLEGDGILVISVESPTAVLVSVTYPETLADIARVLARSPSLRFFPAGADLRRDGQRLVLDPAHFSDDADGAHARTAYLSAGRWTPVLDLHRERIPLEPIDVASGEVRPLGLDLEPHAPAVLEGTVWMGSDALSLVDLDLQQWVTALGGQKPYWLSRRIHTDSSGRFRVECLPGKYRVLLPGVEANSMGVATLPEQLELAPRERIAVDFRVELGTIRLRFLDGQGRPVEGVAGVELKRVSDSGVACTFAPSDGEGWTHFSRCAAGAYDVTTFPRHLSEFRAQVDFAMEKGLAALKDERIELGRVQVAAHQVTELEFTLPPAYFR